MERQYRSMNSQNPNPSDGQQPSDMSDDQTRPLEASKPSLPEPSADGPADPRHEATTGPQAGPQTEPLLPPHATSERPDTHELPGTHGLPGGHGASGGPAAGGPAFGTGYGQAPRQLDFFDWIRSHGVYRGRDRWIGGVSSGIAERMGIDPLIVRGIFIVLTLFAGIGVVLYGIGWALLPEPDGRIHTQEAGAGRWTSGMTGALVTTVIGFTGMGGGYWGWGRDGFGFFWALFWIGGLVYLIYFLTQRNRKRTGAAMNHTPADSSSAYGYTATGGSPADGSAAAFAAGTPAASTTYGAGPASEPYPPYAPNSPYAPNTPYGTQTPYGGTGQGHVPPYGGGFGSVPPRGPAPVPTPVPTPKSKPTGPGAPAVAITAGLALLVGGSLKALDAGNVIDLGDSANAVVWASGAAVLGLGILLAGLRGRTSGILGFFAVVALIIGGIFNSVPNGDRFRFQNADWNPASIEQARDGFQITGGRGTVDLTGLNPAAPLPADVVVPMDVTASNVTVILPRTVPVDVRADMTLGNLHEGTNHRGGITSRQSSYNTDRPGARLILQIDGTVSTITIQEGN